jgi:hypothetical protein
MNEYAISPYGKPRMKEERDNTSRGGSLYAARSLPENISAFATRVLQSIYVCVKGERA